MTEKSNEQLVRALIGAAFHEGTLEHRDSPYYATLKKARDAVEQAKAAVLARMAGPGEVVVQGWQPIETAPKDGSWFLSTRGGVPYVTSWDDGEGRFFTFNRSYEAIREKYEGIADAVWEPTHWQPIPKPPKDGGNDDRT